MSVNGIGYLQTILEYAYRYFSGTKYKSITERTLALPEILVFPIRLSCFFLTNPLTLSEGIFSTVQIWKQKNSKLTDVSRYSRVDQVKLVED